jgi:hypothetical protein
VHLLRDFSGDDHGDHVAVTDRAGDGLETKPASTRREHGMIRLECRE